MVSLQDLNEGMTDARHLPFPDESLSAAYTRNGFNHIGRYMDALKEAHRALPPPNARLRRFQTGTQDVQSIQGRLALFWAIEAGFALAKTKMKRERNCLKQVWSPALDSRDIINI